MFKQICRQGAAKLVARVCAVGLFGCVAASQAGAATAQDSAAYASIVSGTAAVQVIPMSPLLVGSVRATRTPSKPAPVPTVTVSVGKLLYLKPHHRDPVMQFTIHLSRAYKNQVRVAYSTAPNLPGAGSEFKNVTGLAIVHAGNVNYTVRVPITGPVNVPNGEVVLSLAGATNATITGSGQGIGLLTPCVASGKKH